MLVIESASQALNNSMKSPFLFKASATFLLALLLASICLGQTTKCVSLDSQEAPGNGWSSSPSISADGRFVAFDSSSNNLIPGDTNFSQDIFVRDRLLGVTERVSLNSQGVEGNFLSRNPSISATGRYVAFSSWADNLVPGDTNASQDIFVYDRQTGLTKLVSMNSSGIAGNGASDFPSISADGRFVTFESAASNLVLGDTNRRDDIFVFDCQTDTTERVSVHSQGYEGNWRSFGPSISADGRFVIFSSNASNLVPGDTNGCRDTFVRDRLLDLTKRVSLGAQYSEANGSSAGSSISADGRYVVFGSIAGNLVPNDTNNNWDCFVRDRQSGVTERVSVDSQGEEGNGYSFNPVISANGRYVVFTTQAGNLVPNDTNSEWDIFLHDRRFGTTERISVSSQGEEGNGSSSMPSISGDGRSIAFGSAANNLISRFNWGDDVFVHDRSDGLGSNSIYLQGPNLGWVGWPVTLSWSTARPNSDYWLAYSLSNFGTIIRGRVMDLGPLHTVLASGVNSSTGTGSYSSPPAPAGVAGRRLFFEVLARDADGILFDSNAVAIDFF